MPDRVSPMVGGARFELAPVGWESAADSQPVGSATMTFVIAIRVSRLGVASRDVVTRAEAQGTAGGFRFILTTGGLLQWIVSDGGGAARSVLSNVSAVPEEMLVVSMAYDTNQSRMRLSNGDTNTASGFTSGYTAPSSGRTFAVGFRTVSNDLPFMDGGAIYALSMTQAQALSLAEMATYEAAFIDALAQGRVPPTIRSAPIANSDFLWWGQDLLGGGFAAWVDRVSGISLARVGAPELVCHPGRF